VFASQPDSVDFRRARQLKALRRLVAWAEEHGLEVIVRAHPRESRAFWKENFPNIQLDSTNDGFLDCLLRLRPLFVGSWWSTALLDALAFGVLPVTLAAGGTARSADLVFPFGLICSVFPDDQGTLAALSEDPGAYEEELVRRQCLVYPLPFVKGPKASLTPPDAVRGAHP
jgi:hypothetical protein